MLLVIRSAEYDFAPVSVFHHKLARIVEQRVVDVQCTAQRTACITGCWLNIYIFKADSRKMRPFATELKAQHHRPCTNSCQSVRERD